MSWYLGDSLVCYLVMTHVFWPSHEGSHLVNWSTQSSTESIYQRVDPLDEPVDSTMKSTQW